MLFCCHYQPKAAVILGVMFLVVESVSVIYTENFVTKIEMVSKIMDDIENDEEEESVKENDAKESEGKESNIRGNVTKQENAKKSFYIEGSIFDVNNKSESIYCYIDNVRIYEKDGNEDGGKYLCNTGKLLLIIGKSDVEKSKNHIIPGCDIQAVVRYMEFNEKRNDGGFDERKYYYSIGIEGKFSVENYNTVKCKKVNNIAKYKMFQLKMRLCHQILKLAGAGEKQKYAQIYKGILFGEKEEISSDTILLYQMTGISHILSISGLHVSMVGYFIYRLIRKKHGLMFSTISSLTVLYIYILLIGNSYSPKRAFVMFMINVAAELMGRTYDLVSSVSIAFLLIFLENPLCLYNSGVCMSFGAIVGISILYRSVESYAGLKYKITKTFAASMCINMITRPVIIQSYNMIPMYSAIINLLVIPLMSFIVGFGFIGLIMSYLWFFGGRFIFNLGCIILAGYERVCRIFLKLPGAVKIVQDAGIIRTIGYYVFICIFILAVKLACKKKEKLEKSDDCGQSQDCYEKDNAGKVKGIYIRNWLKRVIFISVYFLTFFIITYSDSKVLTVKMIDVGQGDSIFIKNSNITILVDAGSSSKREIKEYTIFPFLKANGVQRLDYLIITHSDYDHISGAKELLNEKINGKNYVRNLVMQDIDESIKDEAYYDLLNEAKKNNVNIILFSKGKIISDSKIYIKCIWPEAGAKGMDKNTLSIVFELQYKDFTMLFTGDLSSEGEEKLIKMGIDKADILKTGHHGSNYSSSEAFLKQVQPKVSIISCGINNRYGHPGEETLERLQKIGSDIYVTSTSGQISIFYKDGKFSIETFLR